jgi:Raf kinase inhibitor-like YbhB/YbcL family protein
VGTFTHWVVYDLPPASHELPENVSQSDDLSGGGRQGRNDFRKPGYGGPCPPPGKPHRYFFKLYALDRALNLPAGAARTNVEDAMRGHILAQAEMMGKFGR